MLSVLTATRQHLCKRKKLNSVLSKRFSNKYCLLSWYLESAHTPLLALQLQGERVSWWCGSAEPRCTLGWPPGTGAPCTQHPNSPHSLQLCKTRAQQWWSSTPPKEFSFLLSPTQADLGDYSWPQMLFGLLLVFLFCTPYPYFEPCKPPLIEVLRKGASLHPELDFHFHI